jgi:hypothetical protein
MDSSNAGIEDNFQSGAGGAESNIKKSGGGRLSKKFADGKKLIAQGIDPRNY